MTGISSEMTVARGSNLPGGRFYTKSSQTGIKHHKRDTDYWGRRAEVSSILQNTRAHNKYFYLSYLRKTTGNPRNVNDTFTLKTCHQLKSESFKKYTCAQIILNRYSFIHVLTGAIFGWSFLYTAYKGNLLALPVIPPNNFFQQLTCPWLVNQTFHV